MKIQRILKGLIAVVAVGVLTVGFSSVAGAQHAGGEEVLGDVVVNPAPPAAVSASDTAAAGTLPVTGSDVATLGGIALAVLVGGVVLVTVARRSRTA